MTFQTALLALGCNFHGIAGDRQGDSPIVFASFYFSFSLILIKGVQYQHMIHLYFRQILTLGCHVFFKFHSICDLESIFEINAGPQ